MKKKQNENQWLYTMGDGKWNLIAIAEELRAIARSFANTGNLFMSERLSMLALEIENTEKTIDGAMNEMVMERLDHSNKMWEMAGTKFLTAALEAAEAMGSKE